jgi:hypothetical protein
MRCRSSPGKLEKATSDSTVATLRVHPVKVAVCTGSAAISAVPGRGQNRHECVAVLAALSGGAARTLTVLPDRDGQRHAGPVGEM